MTHWTPDTDDCVIEISDATGQIVGFVKPSSVHATPESVVAENSNKNLAIKAIVDAVPSLESEAVDWKFSGTGPDRSLVIVLPEGADKAEADLAVAAYPEVNTEIAGEPK